MPKVTGPLLSISARGQIAKSHVFAKWKGVAYARQHVIPANPNTTAQQNIRGIFSFFTRIWNYSGPLSRAPWTAAAVGQPLTDRNLLAKANTSTLYNGGTPAGDLTGYVASPGTGGAPQTGNITVDTSTSGAPVVTVNVPDLPAGWTFSSCIGNIILDNGPLDPTTLPLAELADATAPVSGQCTLHFTDIPAAGFGYFSAWLKLTNASGKTVYTRSTGSEVALS